MTNRKTVTSVAINDEYLEKMNKIKDTLGIPKNKMINQALKEYFTNHDFNEMIGF